MQNVKVMLAGGGTGGHIFPLIPVIRELKKRGVLVAFMGPEEFPLTVLEKEKIDVFPIIQSGKLRRYFSIHTLWDAIKLPAAILQSIFVLYKFKPNILLGKGGYGSIAPVIAAWSLRIPVALHESDAIPGLANRHLKRFASHILLAFEEALPYFEGLPTDVVGNPVRSPFKKLSKTAAQKVLGLEAQRKTVFILGGSQGAKAINSLIKEILPLILKKYSCIISTGEAHKKSFENVNVNNALIKPFLSEDELAAAYSIADLVVSRPGAGALFEIAEYGKPSVLIPIAKSTGGHQEANAKIFENREAAVLLHEESVTPQTLLYAIESILANYDIAAHMSRRAKSFATPDAEKKIADILINTAKHG